MQYSPIVIWALALLSTASAAPPMTKEDFVITAIEESPKSSQETTSTSTTEKPLAPIEIYSMHVISDVSSRYAHTVVSSRVANPAHKAQEVAFSFLLPETAFISGFLMEIGGKVYEAYVKEKEDAKKIYEEAVESGIAAAHVAISARDSNLFTVAINVEPNSKATFNLTYEELLTRHLGVYNNVINLNPEKIVEDLSVEVNINENRPISVLRVPELRSANEIADEDDKENTMATIQQSEDKKKVTIRFSPTSEQQIQLRDAFQDKVRLQKEKSDAEFEYEWNNDNYETPPSDGITGQFVVQYDVERDPLNGEVLVYDGYFVHFFAPTNLKPLNKHVVFVLDVSGSMAGRKINQLKEAMVSILDNLHPGDCFNIIVFDTNVQVYDLDDPLKSVTIKGYDYYYQSPDIKLITTTTPKADLALPPPSPATPEYIEKAKIIIKALEVLDLTNIDEALKTALKLVNAGVPRYFPKPLEKKDSNALKSNEIGQSGKLEQTNIKEIKDVGPVASESNKDNDQYVEPESMIIFLTDGDATVGETNTDKILNGVKDLNSGKNKASIFSLAFGEDADRGLLQKLSLRNNGFLRPIYIASDTAQQLKHFYQEVSSPLLSGIQFVYPPDQVEKDTVTKDVFHTLFSGSEIVVAGKLKDPEISQLTPSVSAISREGDVDFTQLIDRIPKGPKPVISKNHYHPTERLWAYLCIKQLLDEKDAEGENEVEKIEPVTNIELNDTAISSTETPVKEKSKSEKLALNLAMKYSFVTPLTSLVVVKPNNKTSSGNEANLKNPSEFENDQKLSASYSASPAFYNSIPKVAYSYAQPIALQDDEEVEEESYRIPEKEALELDELNESENEEENETESPLQQFGLDGHSWLLQYLLQGSLSSYYLQLSVNGTDVILKLEADREESADNPTSCSNGILGSPGVCKSITACPASKLDLESLESLTKLLCSGNGVAGVCCSENKYIDEPPKDILLD